MQKIKLSTGVDDIKFGIEANELERILGEPSGREMGDDDGMTILHYDEQNLSFGFSKEYGHKLLSITTSDEVSQIEEISLIGNSLQEVLDKLEVLGINDIDIEDISTDEFPDQQLVTAFEFSLNLWFDEDELAEIQWGPFWDNEKDEPVWPE